MASLHQRNALGLFTAHTATHVMAAPPPPIDAIDVTPARIRAKPGDRLVFDLVVPALRRAVR